ncbi:uncharacterized protein DNG_05923 [Cephalotrichum gorgonifer]|uniref:MYND-type domain-containing protein n=1 Tax=Cephalotrichum gorgonifer TaxID=2041049 RepID=A0AAE8SVX9_9PEZI|nr:uncharacterized protein DNG_05923 [Cephalotrichum gorgonifer]
MPPKGTNDLAPRGCEVCHQRDRLLRCTGCLTVYYCSRDHQVSDRPAHKNACVDVKKARAELERIEQKLRTETASGPFGPDIFISQAGHFWSIDETRPYLEARCRLAETIFRRFGFDPGRVDGVQAALDHFMEVSRLARSETMGIRCLIPAFLIRLGRDQEAYDFLKAWAISRGRPDANGGGDMPHPEIKGANVLEPLHNGWTEAGQIDLHDAVVMTVIKFRVLSDLQRMQNAARGLADTFPREITDLIRRELVGSAVVTRPEVLSLDTAELGRLIDSIKFQIKRLFNAVHVRNSHLWEMLLVTLTTGGVRDTDPAETSIPGTRGEAFMTISQSLEAWVEVPNAPHQIKGVIRAMLTDGEVLDRMRAAMMGRR